MERCWTSTDAQWTSLFIQPLQRWLFIVNSLQGATYAQTGALAYQKPPLFDSWLRFVDVAIHFGVFLHKALLRLLEWRRNLHSNLLLSQMIWPKTLALAINYEVISPNGKTIDTFFGRFQPVLGGDGVLLATCRSLRRRLLADQRILNRT